MRTRTWAWVAMSFLLATSCRSTPLDKIWPGCPTCTPDCPQPVACPPTAVSPQVDCGPDRVPTEVVIDESISPAVDCNPIMTQHTLVATVLDQFGQPMAGQRVEWILGRFGDAVGDIIAVDDQYGSGTIAPIANARVTNAGNKFDNTYVASVTNYGPELIDAGNNFPYTNADGSRLPDFTVGVGQSWCTISSGREGVTDIIVYVPAIRDGTKHKIWAKKIWADFAVEFPADAVNLLPEDTHRFPVRVHRSDGTGIPGQTIEAEILDGPAAIFQGAGGTTTRVTSNADGIAELVVRNTAGAPGVNRIKITAVGGFYGESCPRSQIVEKRWQRVALEVACTMPATAPLGRPFEKTITVTNTGDAPAENVILEDTPGGALAFAGGESFPMDLGTIPAGETVTRTIRMVGNAAGTFTNSVAARGGTASAQSGCSVEIVQGQLEITKVCDPARTQAGSRVSFIVTVSNTGRGPLENVVVTDRYPAGITPASQDRTTLGTLLPGESQEIVFAGTADEPGSYTNTAVATADGVPEATATCSLEVVQCQLEMQLIGPETIYFGEPGNFTLEVKNIGDGDASGCTVRITYGGCLGGGFEDFEIGPLAPGEVWRKDWSRTAQTVGPCSIRADSSCGTSCTKYAEGQLSVNGLTALQVEMIDKALDGSEAGVFRVGETFLYRVRIENDAGTEATPEMFADWMLPPELEFISGRSLDGRVDVTGTGRAAKSGRFVLPVGGAIDFEITVRAVSAPASTLTKTTMIVRRASDEADLADETESTTIYR